MHILSITSNNGILVIGVNISVDKVKGRNESRVHNMGVASTDR